MVENNGENSLKAIMDGLTGINAEIEKYIAQIVNNRARKSDGIKVRTLFSPDLTRYSISLYSSRTGYKCNYVYSITELLFIATNKTLGSSLDVVVTKMIRKILGEEKAEILEVNHE